ncbi:hypothetical protein F442_12957 [Phytophthora nicotianae P10297]|uniref:Uncharacterized protein n=1 Tax=Phytophthora nicotianae P10297 TaxID=1317064 RepID=W2YXQ6_PHYNI|nr:hypothetical protein F442_12957 [Phytophthora nicotianae P10297]
MANTTHAWGHHGDIHHEKLCYENASPTTSNAGCTVHVLVPLEDPVAHSNTSAPTTMYYGAVVGN